MFINMYFIFIKGIKKQFVIEKKQWMDDKLVWVVVVIVVSVFVFIVVVIVFLLKCYCDKFFDRYVKVFMIQNIIIGLFYLIRQLDGYFED